MNLQNRAELLEALRVADVCASDDDRELLTQVANEIGRGNMVAIGLVSCIAHLLEYIRPGGCDMDLISAKVSLDSAPIGELREPGCALVPLPRDRGDPLRFPESAG